MRAHTIRAVATTLPDEVNTGNNALIDGTVYIPPLGDVDGHGDVDRYDFGILSDSYGNTDDSINIRDLIILSRNYGRST